MLNDPLSHGLWEKTAPPAPMTAPLNGDHRTDIVVIGGGYTGCSAALHLAQAGAKVTVLEGAEIGFGGAGRNVGLINAGMWVLPADIPGVLGNLYGERLLDLLGNAPLLVRNLVQTHGIACELETNGTLHCAVGPEGLAEIRDRCDQWRARGADVEVLSAEETARRIGTSAYAGALLDRRAGTLQPLAYARGLASAAITAGATIHSRSAAVSTERVDQRWTVRTEHGSVTADWIVVASEFYSSGPFEAVRNEQVLLPYFNLATVPLTDAQLSRILPGREGCWDTKEILSSFRLDHAGRLVFGSVGALRNGGRGVHVGWARRALKKLFPELGTVTFESEWYGRIGMTTDALPRFHRFGPKVVGFSGYNGRGIAPGTVFGQVLARHILGELSEADLPLPVSEVSATPLRQLKGAYYEAGAQLAHFSGARF
ncbi:NAD(P)/FAD-dependent oxidoreductase [Rhizobium halophytocola]|uniref:Glycine/D-amino acid oxidase-like deaminating enzyme n=1 Tax=Rhizobium halophytocola TaxID=735519 RepID=A0ABS4E279_9HYPH|nr:FAD-binding oxidoreductase [Rhizobium halophytocola]MBP1852021.1 glycine/D-amino acid oxidase-like deaminating enzyme [Rhizobium halophytocola]